MRADAEVILQGQLLRCHSYQDATLRATLSTKIADVSALGVATGINCEPSGLARIVSVRLEDGDARNINGAARVDPHVSEKRPSSPARCKKG
jgi:hypothetical protein